MSSRPFLAAATAAFLLGLAPSALAQDPNDALPAGPGKAELVRACTGCHDATTISGTPRTADAWDRVIGDMITNGAELTTEDHAAVYAYLVKNFSPPGSAPPSTPPASDPKPAPQR
jgi:cytochrome c5